MHWSNFFIEAIGSLESRMRLAMRANGCRENWLQTEIMMFANNRDRHLWTNTEPVIKSEGFQSKRHKYDLAAYSSDWEEADLLMIAEIKIMSGHFEPKCLAPSWRNFIPSTGQRRTVSEEEIEAAAETWSLLADAARLRRHPCPHRYLILVLLDLDQDSPGYSKARELHDAMAGVTFVDDPTRETVKSFDGFTVKVWSLGVDATI